MENEEPKPKSEPVPKHSEDKDPVEHPWAVSLVAREWSVVKGAPWSFAITSFAAFVLGAGGASLLYDHFLIPGKEATVEALEEELKSKSASETAQIPEDQSPEFKKLKADYENLKAHSIVNNDYNDPYEWPSLTESQINDTIAQWKPYNIATISIWSNDSDDLRLVASIKTIADALNAKVVRGIGSPGDDCEIEISADDRIGPSLLNLLGQLGKARLDKWKGGESSDVSIFIGARFSVTPAPRSTP